MNYGLWHSIGTVSALVAFLAVSWWAYSPSNRKRFEEDGNMVLETDPLYKKRDPDLQEKAQ